MKESDLSVTIPLTLAGDTLISDFPVTIGRFTLSMFLQSNDHSSYHFYVF